MSAIGFTFPPTIAKTFEEAATMLATNTFGVSFLDYTLDGKLWYDLIELVGIKNMGIIVSHTATKMSDLERTQKARNYMLLRKSLNPIEMAKFLVELDERVKEEQVRSNFRYKLFNNREVTILKDDDIIYIEAVGNYSKYYLTKKNLPPTQLVSKQLHKIQETLNPAVFVRCNQSYIVNIDCIRKSKKDNDSGGMLVLEDNVEIPFTKTYRSNLVEKGFLSEK